MSNTNITIKCTVGRNKKLNSTADSRKQLDQIDQEEATPTTDCDCEFKKLQEHR